MAKRSRRETGDFFLTVEKYAEERDRWHTFRGSESVLVTGGMSESKIITLYKMLKMLYRVNEGFVIKLYVVTETDVTDRVDKVIIEADKRVENFHNCTTCKELRTKLTSEVLSGHQLGQLKGQITRHRKAKHWTAIADLGRDGIQVPYEY